MNKDLIQANIDLCRGLLQLLEVLEKEQNTTVAYTKLLLNEASKNLIIHLNLLEKEIK